MPADKCEAGSARDKGTLALAGRSRAAPTRSADRSTSSLFASTLESRPRALVPEDAMDKNDRCSWEHVV
jgi:hypothetical protein